MTERVKAVAAAGAVAAFWLAVWVLVAGLVAQPLILPGPVAVVVALLRLACDAGTWAILVGSGARILGGLALAAVCGGVMAGVSVRSLTFARLVAPALSFVKATPVACVVVLLLIWLGSARVSIAVVFLMALPGVYFSLVEGLAQVDQPLEQMFRLHGVQGWRLFCAHTWREVLPFVLSCARAVIGMSWKAGVAAELIGMATGTVGERIYQAKLLIETADLLAWTVLVVAASWACERSLDAVARIGRMSFQELFSVDDMENAEGWRKFLCNKYVSTIITLAFGYILTRVGYSNIWPLFGSANQLLSALVLITLCVFLKVTGRQNKTLIVPCVIMLCVTFTALVQRTLALVNAFSAGTAVFMVEGLQLIVAILLMVLGVIIVVTSGKELLSKKAGSEARA